MKRIVSIITTLIIIVLLVLFIVLPKRNFSSNENRYLEKFPKFNVEKLLDGSYMANIEAYVEDHFPFREFFLNLKTNVFKLSGMTKQSDVYFGSDKYLLQDYQKPVNSDKIIRIVNRFVKKLDNVNVDFLLAPTSIYINSDKLPKNSIVFNQGEVINYYKENLNTNFIDVTDALLDSDNDYLYYKTDHHWTTYGANVAYLEYCKNLGLKPYKYNYQLVNDSFYGTLYSKVIDNSLSPDKIYKVVDKDIYEVYYKDKDLTKKSLYEEKHLNEKDKYSYFLDNNHALITITNKSLNNSQELLVIKDSYANSFIPFIAKHYEKIHVIDPRYYRLSIKKYIQENNISNVLFLYNVLTIDEDMGIVSIR